MAETENHAGFVPEQKPSTGIDLATSRPKTRSLNGVKVGIVGGAVVLIVFFAIVSALSPKDPKKPAEENKAPAGSAATDQPGMTAGAINALPGDYTSAIAAQREADEARVRQEKKAREAAAAAAPPPPATPAPQGQRTGPVPYVAPYRQSPGATPLDDELAKMRREAEISSLKRAYSAQSAAVTFGSKGLGISSGGNGPAVIPPVGMPQIPQVTGQIPTLPGMSAAPDTKASRDDANRQDDKAAFATAPPKEESPYNPHALIVPRSKDVVQAGTLIPALFLTGVNSDLPGMLTAQVSQNVYDTPTGSHVLIPLGTRLIGQYDSRVTFGQERVLLIWTRIIFPNGSSVTLEGMPGVDMAGYAGVRDRIDNHYGKLLSGVLFSSVLSTAAVTSQGATANGVNPSYSQLAAQGAGQAVNEAGQKFVQRAMDIQPTLTIRPGFRVGILLSKDIQLPPYGG